MGADPFYLKVIIFFSVTVSENYKE